MVNFVRNSKNYFTSFVAPLLTSPLAYSFDLQLIKRNYYGNTSFLQILNMFI